MCQGDTNLVIAIHPTLLTTQSDTYTNMSKNQLRPMSKILVLNFGLRVLHHRMCHVKLMVMS